MATSLYAVFNRTETAVSGTILCNRTTCKTPSHRWQMATTRLLICSSRIAHLICKRRLKCVNRFCITVISLNKMNGAFIEKFNEFYTTAFLWGAARAP